MALISSRAMPHWLIVLLGLLAILAGSPRTGLALPPPLSPEELAARSDLVIEGRVVKVWPYAEWLAFLQKGGLGAAGRALLSQAPATDAGLLKLIRNFPYKSGGRPARVAIDSYNLAEVRVEKTLKGHSGEVIFIPFLNYHFLNRPLEGPWNERSYTAGEHLQMYLRRNGPFYESTYWNAVLPLDKKPTRPY